jgi:CheY-like chemotaxis protein
VNLIDRQPFLARILVVEDERNIRFLVVSILRQQKHEVIEAVNGVDALRCLEEHGNFDLIVTDILMPEMDGVQLTEAVRQEFPDLPILVVAASQDPAKAALERGANYFLPKPFSYSKFISAFNDL